MITENKEVSIHASSREDATITSHIGGKVHRFQSTRPRGRTRPMPLSCFQS